MRIEEMKAMAATLAAAEKDAKADQVALGERLVELRIRHHQALQLRERLEARRLQLEARIIELEGGVKRPTKRQTTEDKLRQLLDGLLRRAGAMA